MKVYKYKHLPGSADPTIFYICDDDGHWYYISRYGLLWSIDPDPNPIKYQPSNFLELLVLAGISKQQAHEEIRKFRELTELPTR